VNFAADLRRDLADRAQKYAAAQEVPHSLSYGALPIACFARMKVAGGTETFCRKLQGHPDESRVETTVGQGSYPGPPVPAPHCAGTLDGTRCLHQFRRPA